MQIWNEIVDEANDILLCSAHVLPTGSCRQNITCDVFQDTSGDNHRPTYFIVGDKLKFGYLS